jgi:hypothetical protein
MLFSSTQRSVIRKIIFTQSGKMFDSIVPQCQSYTFYQLEFGYNVIHIKHYALPDSYLNGSAQFSSNVGTNFTLAFILAYISCCVHDLMPLLYQD